MTTCKFRDCNRLLQSIAGFDLMMLLAAGTASGLAIFLTGDDDEEI